MAEQKERSANPALSIPVAKFYSNDGTIMDVGLWKGKVVISFSAKEGENYNRASVFLDHELLQFFNIHLEAIARSRAAAYKEDKPYDDILVSFDNSYIDRDTQQVKKNGTFVLTTVEHEGVKRISVIYESGSRTFTTTLVSRLLPKLVQEKFYKKNIDPVDGNFFYFAKIINDCLQASVLYAGFNKIAELITSGGGNDNQKGGYDNRRREAVRTDEVF